MKQLSAILLVSGMCAGAATPMGRLSGPSVVSDTDRAQWGEAYTNYYRWNGGSTGLNASTGRSSLELGSAATLQATPDSTPNTAVQRGASSEFSAGVITATLSGTATHAISADSATSADTLSHTLAISEGGTGATNSAAARDNLGLGDVTDTAQIPLSYLDADTNMAANSDIRVPTQKAVRSAIDSKYTASSSNTPNTLVQRGASGEFSAGTITASLSGRATVATNADTATVAVTANALSHVLTIPEGGTGATDSATARGNLGLGQVTDTAQVPLSYLDTDSGMAANSDTRVATQKAVKAALDDKAAKLLANTTVYFGTSGKPTIVSSGAVSLVEKRYSPSLPETLTLQGYWDLNDNTDTKYASYGTGDMTWYGGDTGDTAVGIWYNGMAEGTLFGGSGNLDYGAATCWFRLPNAASSVELGTEYVSGSGFDCAKVYLDSTSCDVYVYNETTLHSDINTQSIATGVWHLATLAWQHNGTAINVSVSVDSGPSVQHLALSGLTLGTMRSGVEVKAAGGGIVDEVGSFVTGSSFPGAEMDSAVTTLYNGGAGALYKEYVSIPAIGNAFAVSDAVQIDSSVNYDTAHILDDVTTDSVKFSANYVAETLDSAYVYYRQPTTQAEAQALITMQPRVLEGKTLTFRFRDGWYTFSDYLDFNGFGAGLLLIRDDSSVTAQMKKVVVSSTGRYGLRIYGCSSPVQVYYLHITVNSGLSAPMCLLVSNSSSTITVYYDYMELGAGTLGMGVGMTSGAYINVAGSYFEGGSHGVYVETSAAARVSGCYSIESRKPVTGLNVVDTMTILNGHALTGLSADTNGREIVDITP